MYRQLDNKTSNKVKKSFSFESKFVEKSRYIVVDWRSRTIFSELNSSYGLSLFNSYEIITTKRQPAENILLSNRTATFINRVALLLW